MSLSNLPTAAGRKENESEATMRWEGRGGGVILLLSEGGGRRKEKKRPSKVVRASNKGKYAKTRTPCKKKKRKGTELHVPLLVLRLKGRKEKKKRDLSDCIPTPQKKNWTASTGGKKKEEVAH